MNKCTPAVTRTLQALAKAPEGRLARLEFCAATGVKRRAVRTLTNRMLDQDYIAAFGDDARPNLGYTITFKGLRAIGAA